MTIDKPFGPFLMNRFGERYLPEVNQEAFSRVGSDNLFGQQFSERFAKTDSLFLVAGSDSGLLVDWVVKRKRPEGSRFVFLEFPELIARLTEEAILPAELPSWVTLCPPDAWAEDAEKLSLKDYFYLGQVYPVQSLAVMDGQHDGYVAMYNGLETALGQYRLQVNQEIGNRVFMVKCLENLCENRIPVSVLSDRFRGRTAVLLAGGPSLPESFPWIAAHRERIVVLAVARVADHLRKAGIEPDLFFAIDPHDVIFHQSKGILPFWKRSLLVHMYHLNPALLGQWRGRGVYMGGAAALGVGAESGGGQLSRHHRRPSGPGGGHRHGLRAGGAGGIRPVLQPRGIHPRGRERGAVHRPLYRPWRPDGGHQWRLDGGDPL